MKDRNAVCADPRCWCGSETWCAESQGVPACKREWAATIAAGCLALCALVVALAVVVAA